MTDLSDLDLAALNQPTPAPGQGQISYGAPPPVQPGAEQNVRVLNVGEEVIQIVPHPTTNRYPWTPVENPKVPIYQTVDVPAAAVPQPPSVAIPVVPAAPTPSQAIPVAAAVQPSPLQQAPPVVPAPPTVHPPPEASAPQPPAAPIQLPATPVSLPAAQPPAHPHRPAHIYSDYTREVWRVFRPSKTIRFLILSLVLIVIIGAVGFWLASGAPTDIMKLPILQPIIHAQ